MAYNETQRKHYIHWTHARMQKNTINKSTLLVRISINIIAKIKDKPVIILIGFVTQTIIMNKL